MKRFAQIFFFVILLIPLVISACTLPRDNPPKETESMTEIDAKNSGTVTGKICYPSESIPPMTLYFQSSVHDKVETLQIEAN